VVNLTSVSDRPELPMTQSFAQEVNFSAAVRDGKPEEGVVCSWPDPRKCPELGKTKWELYHENIIPGPLEAMKTWSLKKDNETVEINIFVSSKGNHLAQNRFLSIGSLSSLPGLPYKKGTRGLGQYSAESLISGNNRYFWVFHNVVFDVICFHVTFDIDKLLKWLNKLAVDNTRTDIAAALPPVDGFSCPKTEPKTGEDIKLTVKTPTGIKSDFEVDGVGLRLTGETRDTLLFTATEISENLLTLFNVNKDTLLTNAIDFRVTVT
jgi:hypothetical protein